MSVGMQVQYAYMTRFRSKANCGCHVDKIANTARMGARINMNGLYLPNLVLVFCNSLLKNGWMMSPSKLAIKHIHAPWMTLKL